MRFIPGGTYRRLLAVGLGSQANFDSSGARHLALVNHIDFLTINSNSTATFCVWTLHAMKPWIYARQHAAKEVANGGAEVI